MGEQCNDLEKVRGLVDKSYADWIVVMRTAFIISPAEVSPCQRLLAD